MSLTLAEYVNAGLELSPDDRAEAARLLQAAENEGGADRLGPGWLEEIDTRVGEIMSGKALLLNADEAHAQLVAELMSKR